MTITEEEQRKQRLASSFFDYPPVVEQSESTKRTLASTSLIPRLFMDTEILYLLNFGSKSGYELKKQLLSVFGIKVSYGTLYPHLHALERGSLIKGTWKTEEESARPNKKVYALTQDGAFTLKESIASFGKIGLAMQFIFNKLDLDFATPLPTNERESTLTTIQALLRRRGYSTSRETSLRGFSGKEYRFEIAATRIVSPKIVERTIVHIADCRAGPQLSMDQAMKILVVAQDVGAKVLLFSVPQLNVDVAGFLNFHKLAVFDGNNWQDVMSDFLLRYDRSLE